MAGFPPAPKPRVIFLSDLHPLGGGGVNQRLSVSIHRPKFNPREFRGNHPVDRITTAPTHTDDLNSGLVTGLD